MLTPQTLGYLALISTVLGTLGGIVEAKSTQGSGWYKLGALLASLGVDLASLAKIGQGPAK